MFVQVFIVIVVVLEVHSHFAVAVVADKSSQDNVEAEKKHENNEKNEIQSPVVSPFGSDWYNHLLIKGVESYHLEQRKH